MEQLTLFAEEAPARHSASQDSGRLWTARAASSCSNISELVMRLTRNGLSGKTCPAYYRQMADALSAHCSQAWPNSGLMGGAAWRVLDAQFFGVAQRRRRVFLVVNTRDWRRAAPVLFERESLCWDYPSSREKRQALTERPDAGIGTAARSIDFNPTAGRFQWPEDPGLVQTLTAMMGTGGNTVPPIYCGHEPVAIAGNIINRQPRNGGNGLGYETDGAMYTLTATDRHAVGCAGDSGVNMPFYRDMAPTLTAHDANSACFVNPPNKRITSDADAFSGRRITPVECERLQGCPDGYTDVPWRGTDHAPDSKRYKALGNSLAVPVMRWIGEGIELVRQHDADTHRVV